MEIPKNECPGCAARDDLIQKLAERIDQLEKGEGQEPKELSNVEDFKKWTVAK